MLERFSHALNNQYMGGANQPEELFTLSYINSKLLLNVNLKEVLTMDLV